MAISSWKLLQPVFRVNQQTYRYLSGIRKRETMALSRSKRARGPDRGSRRSSATGFQKNEIRLSPGKDSYTNEFIVTGSSLSAGVSNVGSSPVDLPGTRAHELPLSGTRSGLECKTCLNLMLFGKKTASSRADRKDFTKTKESLCGLLFNCYVVCLFVFGSNVPLLS
ncbi:uncharacterized protein LOC110052063 [Orbicella faveolata]|uniref:uncharacterized protein LOC110052063 n=1 Tax=Orbicella faveolata TaxID=48498 RepID=UPI0009E524A4|nr:uncharacterized protein LOC110052063 [Orbicella faveolata]